LRSNIIIIIMMSKMWGSAAVHVMFAKVDTRSAPMHRGRLVTTLNTDTRCPVTALRHDGGLPIIASHLGVGGAVVDIAKGLVVRPTGQARAVIACRMQHVMCGLMELSVDDCFTRCSVTRQMDLIQIDLPRLPA
jgi:hypothetical protein